MIEVKDFFIPQNSVSSISGDDYQKIEVLTHLFDAISRTTDKSIYVIDYFNKNFLYVSDNSLFLCGHTAEEIKEMGYMFYINNVPEEEQEMLAEINRAGFEFINEISADDRINYTISYDFHILNGKRKTLINQKLTSIFLTKEGKTWIAVCVVSLSTHSKPGQIEIRKTNQSSFWKYSLEQHRWKEEAGLSLNDREKDILSLSAQGYTMSEIAEKLFLSIDTIKFHKKKLFEKLDVKNIMEALSFASNYKLL